MSSIGPTDVIWESMPAPSSRARSPTTGASRSRGSRSVASSVCAARRASVDASWIAWDLARIDRNRDPDTANSRMTMSHPQSGRRCRLVKEPNIPSSRFEGFLRVRGRIGRSARPLESPEGGISPE